MSAMFGGVNPSLGRVVGCVDPAYFAFLTCSDLFKNSYECSHVWGRLVHVSAMSSGIRKVGRVCGPCLLRFLDLFQNSCKCSHIL